MRLCCLYNRMHTMQNWAKPPLRSSARQPVSLDIQRHVAPDGMARYGTQRNRSMAHQNGEQCPGHHGNEPPRVEPMVRGGFKNDGGADVQEHPDGHGQRRSEE